MLQVENLTKYYGQHKGLSGLSFSLQAGDILGVLGPNGSGKTTLFRLLLGLIPPTVGQIILSNSKENSLIYGYLPEERSVYRDISILEQVTYLAKLKKMNRTEITRESSYWFYRFSLESQKNRLIRELSKGNQQKVQFICALIHKPSILILDEPLTGLDATNTTLFKEIMMEESKKGKIILLSSHQYEEIETFCNQVIVLNKGEVALSGQLNQLKQQDGRVLVTLDEDSHQQYKHLDGLLSIRRQGNYTVYIFKDRASAEVCVNQASNPTCKIEPISLRDLVGEYS